MTSYYLGADVGGTNTRLLIADETGRAIGYGQTGPGNHEEVGYAGFSQALSTALQPALSMANVSIGQIHSAAFGIAGYDWPAQREVTLRGIKPLGLVCPIEIVNDAIIGLLAGSESGWGIAVVSGTGSNCHGLDQTRRREGQVTGGGNLFGEGTGSGELVAKAIQSIAYEWTRRGPATQLTPAFIQYLDARNVEDLLEGLMTDRFSPHASAAPIVFKAAANGDKVAFDLIRWAGHELAELAKCVIRQLDLAELAFDVVMVGSMFDGSPLLAETLQSDILAVAPRARFVRLTMPPVIGAVLLAMERAGLDISSVRSTLTRSVNARQQNWVSN